MIQPQLAVALVLIFKGLSNEVLFTLWLEYGRNLMFELNLWKDLILDFYSTVLNQPISENKCLGGFSWGALQFLRKLPQKDAAHL